MTNKKKRSPQTINDFKVVHTYQESEKKLTDIIHSKEFVEYLYQLVIKYN